MHKPTARARRIATLTAGPVAILLAGLFVWQASTAAFTAQTRNSGNNWETGSVVLFDDDGGAASFRVTGAVPGQTGSRCIVVTSQSNVPGEVRFYVAQLSAQGLENNILMALEVGTGGSFADCTGFVPDGPSAPAATLAQGYALSYDYATGMLPWVTTGTPGENMTYRATWTFDVTGLSQTEIDALQGKSASVDVVWELQTD